jgi:hypothetical protein
MLPRPTHPYRKVAQTAPQIILLSITPVGEELAGHYIVEVKHHFQLTLRETPHSWMNVRPAHSVIVLFFYFFISHF